MPNSKLPLRLRAQLETVRFLRTPPIIIVTLAASIVGCAPATGPASEENIEANDGVISLEPEDTPGVRFRLQIKSGEHAGSYQLDSYDAEPCQIGMLGENLFTVNGSGQAPSLIYAETFIADFQAGGDTTEVFSFGATSAEFEFGVDRLPNSFSPGGQGTASYTDDGENDIRITITGESHEGTPFEATVDCERVGRFPN